MYFPDRGCVHTLLTLYVYATAGSKKTLPHFAAVLNSSVCFNTLIPRWLTTADVNLHRRSVGNAQLN